MEGIREEWCLSRGPSSLEMVANPSVWPQDMKLAALSSSALSSSGVVAAIEPS